MKKAAILLMAILWLPARAARPGASFVNDSGSQFQSTGITAAKSAPDQDSQDSTEVVTLTAQVSTMGCQSASP